MITPAELPIGPPQPLRALDPNAPAGEHGALFGFAIPAQEARIVVIPVPYEVTVSSRGGTERGPKALLDASAQVDFLDPVAGEPWRVGLAAIPESEEIRALSEAARETIETAREGDEERLAFVDRCGRAVWDYLDDAVWRLFSSGRTPLVVGGEHAISFGAIRAAARRHPGIGVLQVDAHADLRQAYEGFSTSHASVMKRVLELPELGRLVQVGLRDVSREELEVATAAGGRAIWFTDAEIARREFKGESWGAIVDGIVSELPPVVWISFDIDGLEPSLCPATGTPVPGGLTWREASHLIAEVARSGRTIIGADLVEAGPEFWDGFVAAKLLYLLAGAAAGTVVP